MTLLKFSNHSPSCQDRYFDSIYHRFPQHETEQRRSTRPSVNIKESTNGYILELAVPGYSKDDFKIEINNDLLVISSDRKNKDESGEKANVSRSEFSYTSFSKMFTLPDEADGEKITAQYENGILRLSIPKKEVVKPKASRTIGIK